MYRLIWLDNSSTLHASNEPGDLGPQHVAGSEEREGQRTLPILPQAPQPATCHRAKSSAVTSTGISGISVLVSDHDCDEQPSYEYCGEGTQWF